MVKRQCPRCRSGRKTEVEMFAGTMIKLGEKHNIPTPYNQVLERYGRYNRRRTKIAKPIKPICLCSLLNA